MKELNNIAKNYIKDNFNTEEIEFIGDVILSENKIVLTICLRNKEKDIEIDIPEDCKIINIDATYYGTYVIMEIENQ